MSAAARKVWDTPTASDPKTIANRSGMARGSANRGFMSRHSASCDRSVTQISRPSARSYFLEEGGLEQISCRESRRKKLYLDPEVKNKKQ